MTNEKDSHIFLAHYPCNEKGPVVGLIAGINGYDYPPVIGLQKLPQLIHPTEVKGTVMIMAHGPNVEASWVVKFTVILLRGKNLNSTICWE